MQEQLLIEDWGLPVHASDDNFAAAMTEAIKSSDGKLYIEGVFMQAEVVNRNGRKYPRKILEQAVNKYIREQVKTHQALGELNHPPRPNVDPNEAAIRITEMWWDGNNVMGKALVLNTNKGNQVRALIEGGWIPGVSSRGLGTVKNINGINEVQDGFRLTVGVDVVWGPSAPDAYVKASFNESATVSNTNDSTFSKLTEALEKLL